MTEWRERLGGRGVNGLGMMGTVRGQGRELVEGQGKDRFVGWGWRERVGGWELGDRKRREWVG